VDESEDRNPNGCIASIQSAVEAPSLGQKNGQSEMSGTLATQVEPAPLEACTIARNVQEFDLLIEDMETELGEAWGDLSFDEAIPFLSQPEAASLEFVAVAVDKKDEPRLSFVAEIIRHAKSAGIKVILIADGLGPMPLHDLLRDGANDFVPYPLPEGALAAAIERLNPATPVGVSVLAGEGPVVPPVNVVPNAAGPAEDPTNYAQAAHFGGRPAAAAHGGFGGAPGEPIVVAIHGLAGGVGASTMATNLAWEIATLAKDQGAKVCVLDLDLQFGTISTYLELKRKPMIYEVLADVQRMDQAAFEQALQSYRKTYDVFTAPLDILPLDLLAAQDVKALIDLAKKTHDFVIIDMPTTIVSWTETILTEADAYFAVAQLDLRSAQNILRLMSAMVAEKLPSEKVSYILNRGPKDISGKGRIKRMADNIGIEFKYIFQDGGDAVLEANDNAEPLADNNTKLPFRKDLAALAQTIWQASHDDSFDLTSAAKPKARSFFGFGR